MRLSQSKIILLLLLFTVTTLAQSKRKDAKPLTVGFSIYLFNEVDIRDATVAIQMWGNELMGNLGLNYFPEAKIFDTNQDIVSAIKNNKLDLISLLITDYFEIEKQIEVEPYLITSVNGVYGYNLILLVRKESGIRNIKDLKNMRINTPTDGYGKLSDMWLEVILNKNGEKFDTYFSERKKVNKPSQALFPVFFKQTDACVIPEPSYLTMLELNPQLKNDLIVIEKSPSLVNGIMCINKNLDEDVKKLTLDTAQKLSQTASGKQILTLFKSEGLVKFKPEYIKSTKELVDKYKQINK